jgi:hypothetical protein
LLFEVGGKGRRSGVSAREMRSPGVAVLDPYADRRAGVIEALEERVVEQLATHASVRALDERVLSRLVRRGIMPIDFGFSAPGEHRVRGVP